MKQLALSEPHVIMMVGIPGSGKSFFANHFANTFNAPIISYQNIRDSLFKKPQDYRSETLAVKKVARILLPELLKTKQTFIYDGPLESRQERDHIAKLVRGEGYKPVLLWVQTESSAAKDRATKRTKDGRYLTNDEFDAVLKSFTPPIKSEGPIVISGKHTYASQLKIVLKHLTEPRAKANNLKSKEITVPSRHIAIR